MSIVASFYPRNYIIHKNTPVELTMGLEVHAQLNSEYKLFSGLLNTLTVLDVGLPGSLPTLNLNDVFGIKALADVLNSKVSSWLSFTRKGYFCADMATGYQITQHYNPLLTHGNLDICTFGVSGVCRVMSAHIQSVNLEHDTGSLNVLNAHKTVSFARAGAGLLEFVSFPCFDSVLFVKLFILKLKLVLLCLRVSCCVMADAEMRYDFNISAGKPLSTRSARTEIKNLNSLSGLGYIVSSEALSAQLTKHSCTKTIEFKTFNTLFLRKKERALDYKRLFEADLPFVHVSTGASCAHQRLLCARKRVCWLLSCGQFSFVYFLSFRRSFYKAYALSRAGFSFLNLMLKHALIV